MAASTMSSADSFGHFRLPLTMNKGHIVAKQAERLFATKEKYLERLTQGRPEGHANRNLLGMLAFRLDEYETALEYLDNILSQREDPDNLNALANRKYICEKLFRYNEARDCERKIQYLLSQDDEKRLRQLRARSIAEQAFAFSNEIYEESVTCERHRTAFGMYQAAIELAGEDVPKDEREDWDYESALACSAIYVNVKWDKSQKDEAKRCVEHAVKNFIQIIESSTDNIRKSEGWRRLGDFFQQPKDLLPCIPERFQNFASQPNKCLEESLSLSPDDPQTLARYAQYYMKTDKTKALELVGRSLQFDSSDCNLHARHVRASIYMSQYKQQRKNSKTSRFEQHPDDTLLNQAAEDLSLAVQDVSRPWYTEEMAEVFYYMATDPHGRVRQGNGGQENLQKALTYCAKAVATADGAKRPNVHKFRGMCLCAMGEHEAALACYKRAVERESAASFHSGSIGLLVTEYEHVLKPIASTLSGDSPMVADMVYWLNLAASDCLDSDWTMWEVKYLKKLPGLWSTFVKYCNEKGHKTELMSIEQAATDRRQPPATQQHFIPASVKRSLVGKRLDQSLIPATNQADEELQGSDLNQLRRHPHAIRTLSHPASGEELYPPVSACRRPLSVPATSAIYSEDRLDAENVAAPLSSMQIGGDATESNTVQITYLLNVKTGKIQQIPTIPSAEDIPTEDVRKQQIKPAPADSFSSKFKYDFFVIYSDSASEWVQRCMLEELEGTSRLKGCIKDREFRPGKPILTEYSESIDNSSCTLIVITNDLETDNLCSYAMLQAVQHGRLVIPIPLEDRDMPVLLRHLVPLNATGLVDWARLVRSIEQQIKLDYVP